MTPRNWPKPLQPGDRVAVVSPSGPCNPARLRVGVGVLESWGLKVEISEHAYGRDSELNYLSGTDQDRAADFTHAWIDKNVAAVWAARGGYGSQRMVDLIDLDLVRAAGPKHLVGYSDITALHTRIGRELGQVTLHAPVASSVEQLSHPGSAAQLRRLLFETPRPGDGLCAGQTILPGSAKGMLIGGNLSLVASDLGIEPNPDRSSIALFEEVHESPYQVDRMLTQLLRSGWFSSVAGITLGEFTYAEDPEAMHRTMLNRLVDLGVPIVGAADVGHKTMNLAMPMGAEVVLDADRGLLSLA